MKIVFKELYVCAVAVSTEQKKKEESDLKCPPPLLHQIDRIIHCK